MILWYSIHRYSIPFFFNPSRKIDEVKLIVLLGDTTVGCRRTNLGDLQPVCKICITGLLLQQNYEHRNKRKLCLSLGAFGHLHVKDERILK